MRTNYQTIADKYARAAALEKRAKARLEKIREEILATGDKKLVGKTFTVNVTATDKAWTWDGEALKTILGARAEEAKKYYKRNTLRIEATV